MKVLEQVACGVVRVTFLNGDFDVGQITSVIGRGINWESQGDHRFIPWREIKEIGLESQYN